MTETKKIAAVLGCLVIVGLMIYGAQYYGFNFEGQSERQAKWQEREQKLNALHERLKQVADQIKEFQGRSICKYDSQCRIVGIGAKTCGLYKSFVVYSTFDADESRLLRAIDEFNQGHDQIAGLSLAANSCGFTPATVRCDHGHCDPDH